MPAKILTTHQSTIVMCIVDGTLSIDSDNIFVATAHIKEIVSALNSGAITHEHFEVMAIIINTGTNRPSITAPIATSILVKPLSCSY